MVGFHKRVLNIRSRYCLESSMDGIFFTEKIQQHIYQLILY